MTPKQLEDVVNKIESHKGTIFSKQELAKGLEKYVFLKNCFNKRQISNNAFKSTYKDFYKLNGAGLTPRFVEKYFNLLSKSDKRTSLCDILQKLYQIPNYKGKNTVQFSFATKLLHTIDNNRPIYDSKVACVFELGNAYSKRGNAKILWCKNTYENLRDKYAKLLKEKRIKKVISEMRYMLPDAKDISNTKALDFILWLMPKNKKKRNYDIPASDRGV